MKTKTITIIAICLIGLTLVAYQNGLNAKAVPGPGLGGTEQQIDQRTHLSSMSWSGHSVTNELMYYIDDAGYRLIEFGDPFESVKDVAVVHVQQVPAATELRYDYSTSFNVDMIAAQKTDILQDIDVFYVLGTTDVGTQVVEKWVHKLTKFQQPNSPTTYQLKRSTIYSGTNLGVIDMIEVEPYGAFLLVSHSNPTPRLTQIQITPGYPETQLLNSTLDQLLSTGVSGIYRGVHSLEGMMIWRVHIYNDPYYDAIVIRDLDSDGVLDDWIAYGESEMNINYSLQLGLPWSEDFQYYGSNRDL